MESDGSGSLSAFSWRRCVERSGEQGLRWIQEFRTCDGQQILETTERSLELGRRGCSEEAVSLLAEARDRIRHSLRPCHSQYHVLMRFHDSVAAYHEYRAGCLDAAERLLDAAADDIRRAIELDRFLLPIAHHYEELLLQKARIARRRRRWRELRSLVALISEVLESRHPCLVLTDGTRVHLRDILSFYQSIPDLSDEERVALHRFAEPHSFALLKQRALGELYAGLGVLIPYP